MAADQPLLERLTPPGFAVWLTGLPASGKTTVAHELRRLLAERGLPAVLIDSDDLRRILTPQPAYTDAERDWFYGVIIYLAAWLARSGVNVLMAATAHRQAYRQLAREQIERFVEVYVRCPIEVCRRRDPKGIYRLAQQGQAGSVPGVGVTYEPPAHPDVVVDTDRLSAAEAADTILAQLILNVKNY
jgi:adenylylsulfate kinase